MSAKFFIPGLKANAGQWPNGFVDSLLALGKIEGDFVHLDDATLNQLRVKFPETRSRATAPSPVALRQPSSEKSYLLANIKIEAKKRPHGYLEFILSHGKVEGDTVILDESTVTEIRVKFPTPPPPPPLPEPTITEMAANFTQAMAGWVKAGFKVVAREVYEQRHAICLSCEYWDAKARAGQGKCLRCGCSRAKLWLAPSKCPLNPPKW